MCKVADFGLYYHNFKYGHGNAKKVSNIVSWLHFKQLIVANAELFFFCRLSCQGCVPVKWTAPEVLFGDIAELSSKSDVYVILFMKLLNCFLFFCDERMIFPRGGGGYCLIWVIRVRAAVIWVIRVRAARQGMVLRAERLEPRLRAVSFFSSPTTSGCALREVERVCDSAADKRFA